MNQQKPDRQPPITKEDLEEANRLADEGVFVSAEKVREWMRSWGTENELPRPKPDVFKQKR